MPVRQVQADEVPRHHLREVRRRGDAQPRSAASAWATSSWPRPVAHIWFLKSLPSPHRPAARHDAADLERVLYFENYVVIEPGLTRSSRTSC